MLGLALVITGMIFLFTAPNKAVTVSATTSTTSQIATPPVDIKPQYEAILKEAGWLEYVKNNLDIIQYYDYMGLSADGKPDSEFVGQASMKDTSRVAIILTKRPDLDVAATLVHEATHHKARKETGYWSSQEDATTMAEQFKHDYIAAFELRRSHQKK